MDMSSSVTFPAHAFHTSLPGGRASGSLSVGPMGLQFARDNTSVTLPLSGLELKLGGASNRLIFCTHPARPDWQLYTADHGLLKAPALVGHPAVQAVGGARVRHHSMVWGSITAVLAVLVVAGFLLYGSMNAMSAMAAQRIPAEWEQKLGQSVMAQYRLQHELLDEKETKALLGPLTVPLAAAMADKRHPLHFYIVNDPAINAFALPGGYIVVNSGLILKARRAEEMQGVIGHEISHVTGQHGLRAVIRSTGVYVIAQALIGDASGLLAALANAGPLLLNQKYSRDFEREADAEGYNLLKRAHVNPRGMTDFFRIILEEEKKQLAKIEDEKARAAMDTAMIYFGSHPETEERIARLEKKMAADASSGWRDDQAVFIALQARVKTFVSEKEGESENNDKGQ